MSSHCLRKKLVCRLWCLNCYRRQIALSRTSVLTETISVFGHPAKCSPLGELTGRCCWSAWDGRGEWGLPGSLAQLPAPPGVPAASHPSLPVWFLLPETPRPSLQGPRAAPLPAPEPPTTGCPTLCPRLRLLSKDGQPASAEGQPTCLLAGPLEGSALNSLHPQSPSVLGWSPDLQGDTASPEGE